ncbi:MAG: apolipoprotein N-acyltransferase, partial [Pseudomonadota bacterium]
MRAPLADLSTRLAGLSGRNRALAYGVLGAFGGLGHAPVAIPAFTVLALVMVFATRPWLLPRKAAAWAGWAFGAGYFAVTLHWIVEPFLVDVWRHGWMAPFALVLMCGGLALFWAAAFGVAGWRRSGLALVAAWAVAEFARANVFTGFPWGMIVTTGVEVWLYQGAAWLGPHGLTLALLLAALATVSGPQSVRWV